MVIALDATYSVDRQPSGVGVYSRQILDGLNQQFPEDTYIHCYRWKQWKQRGFRGRPLLPFLPTVKADVFHALNQRVDHRTQRGIVCTFHDLFVMSAQYSSPEYRDRFRKQAEAAAANTDLVIAVSNFTALQVSDLLKVPRSRIRVIPHGVIQPARPRFAPESPFVLSVGALQVRKNIERLVRAFEALPDAWRLILAGSPSGYKGEEILAAIRQSPCASRIQVTGYVSRGALDDLYASASIFAFPSLDEGFGIPVLEAMANQVPVLTSRTSALQEVGAGAALLVDPYRVDEIAEALKVLAQDGEIRKQLIEAGKARSLEYTWERAVALTHAAYSQLAG